LGFEISIVAVSRYGRYAETPAPGRLELALGLVLTKTRRDERHQDQASAWSCQNRLGLLRTLRITKLT